MSIEQDAKRYQHIRELMGQAIKVNAHGAIFILHPPGKKAWFDTLEDVDAAIDEQMEEAK